MVHASDSAGSLPSIASLGFAHVISEDFQFFPSDSDASSRRSALMSLSSCPDVPGLRYRDPPPFRPMDFRPRFMHSVGVRVSPESFCEDLFDALKEKAMPPVPTKGADAEDQGPASAPGPPEAHAEPPPKAPSRSWADVTESEETQPQPKPDRSHEPECRHAQRRYRQKKEVEGKAYSYDRTNNHVSVLHRMRGPIVDQRSLLKRSLSVREAFAGVRVCRARVAPVSNPSSPHTRRAPPPCGVPP